MIIQQQNYRKIYKLHAFLSLELINMQVFTLYTIEIGEDINLPFFGQGVKAGFPSPAFDYRAESINLTKLLIQNPANTEIVRVNVDVFGGGYSEGDLLIVVKGHPLKDNCKMIVTMYGEQFIYTYRRKNKLQFFEDHNGNIINDISDECILYGIITYVIHPIFPSHIKINKSDKSDKVDINKLLIKTPARTFITKVDGNSMIDKRFLNNDLLVVEKGREPIDGNPVVAYLDEEYCLKSFRKDEKSGNYLLEPANTVFDTIVVTPANSFIIWGIVMYVIHKEY